jgi:hypothetical protein
MVNPYRLAATRVANLSWHVSENGRALHYGWLPGSMFHPDLPIGQEYAARRAFSDWWSPAEYRNDGLRTNETASEKGQRLGHKATAAALLEFADLQETGQ